MTEVLQKTQQEERAEREAYWQPILADWQSSGLTVKEYCRTNQVNESRFKYWQTKLLPESKRSGQKSAERARQERFIPVQLKSAMSANGDIEIRYREQYSICVKSGFDEAHLRRCLQVLQSC
jgi:hypothetical protein